MEEEMTPESIIDDHWSGLQKEASVSMSMPPSVMKVASTYERAFEELEKEALNVQGWRKMQLARQAKGKFHSPMAAMAERLSPLAKRGKEIASAVEKGASFPVEPSNIPIWAYEIALEKQAFNPLPAIQGAAKTVGRGIMRAGSAIHGAAPAASVSKGGATLRQAAGRGVTRAGAAVMENPGTAAAAAGGLGLAGTTGLGVGYMAGRGGRRQQ